MLQFRTNSTNLNISFHLTRCTFTTASLIILSANPKTLKRRQQTRYSEKTLNYDQIDRLPYPKELLRTIPLAAKIHHDQIKEQCFRRDKVQVFQAMEIKFIAILYPRKRPSELEVRSTVLQDVNWLVSSLSLFLSLSLRGAIFQT